MQKLLVLILVIVGIVPVISGQSDHARSFFRKIINKGDSMIPKIESRTVSDTIIQQSMDDTIVTPNIIPAASKKGIETDSIPDEQPTLFFAERKSCKSYVLKPLWFRVYAPVALENVRQKKEPMVKETIPFLQVHGNILYDVNYNSNIDTPYNEKNVYQHTVQTYLDILVKGEYPFRIFLTNRFSNSSLFRNYSDYNFSYTSTEFSRRIREKVKQRFLSSLPDPKLPDSLQRVLDGKITALKELERWINNPALLQKMVEVREKAMRDVNARKDSAVARAEKVLMQKAAGVTDSAAGKIKAKIDSVLPAVNPEIKKLDSLYQQRKRDADSLSKSIKKLEDSIRSIYQQLNQRAGRIANEIDRADNPALLQEKMQQLHIGDSILPKGYKTLMALRSFGLGRSVVNYSELSAKNISINGVQAEFNPSSYYAVASGTVDYRFRDFVVNRGQQQSRQYLNVFRYGKGFRDRSNIILTYYVGRKQLYNAGTIDSVHAQVPSSALMGITLEGNYKLTDHITVTAEIAKSSAPAYINDSTRKNALGSQLLQMSNRNNEAWSVSANAFFPRSKTRISGSYKHIGIHFQSFSLFTDGSSQTAWSGRVTQLLFNDQLDLTAAANTNDFSNPFISQQYKSSTVFKSVQATLRKQGWPVISLGYFPSSQITKLGDGIYRENLFYTLVGNVTYSYRLGQVQMNSMAIYTQFYNRSADSGFVYFNTRNLMLGQAFFAGRFVFNANLSAALNQQYRLYTIEGKTQVTLNKYLLLGAGMKYNRQTVFNIDQLGYSAQATLRLSKFGQLQFSADKGFIPGVNRQLVSNNTGRASYFKTF